jgi:hypothetical protein
MKLSNNLESLIIENFQNLMDFRLAALFGSKMGYVLFRWQLPVRINVT